MAGAAWAAELLILIRVSVRLHGEVGWAAWRDLGYFTNFANLLVAAVFTHIALFGEDRVTARRLGLALISILLVAAVYWTILRGWRVIGHNGPGEVLAHLVVPALVPAWWWRFGRRGLTRADPLVWALFPILYLAYALARGAVTGWYPYYFLDPARVGWGGIALFALGIAAIFFLAGELLVRLDRRLAPRVPLRKSVPARSPAQPPDPA